MGLSSTKDSPRYDSEENYSLQVTDIFKKKRVRPRKTRITTVRKELKTLLIDKIALDWIE